MREMRSSEVENHSEQQEQQQQGCTHRQLAFQATHQQHLFNSLVANPHSFAVIAQAHEALVVLPPHSRFIMGDLMDKRTLAPLLPPAGVQGETVPCWSSFPCSSH
eukprot:537427-Pelagomonas_calceolata.AAC.3